MFGAHLYVLISTGYDMKILVVALDWGLGHASRCIPVIEALEKAGVKVVLGTSGRAAALWRQSFPQLLLIELPAYGIRYPFRNMYLNIFLQLPRIVLVAFAEHIKLRRLVKQMNIDAIVSDNRFGCFHTHVPSIFISHQIHIQLPHGWIAWIVNKIHRVIIGCYDECWVPDFADSAISLSGALSHPAKLQNIRYIGPLSRLQAAVVNVKYDIVALLSGPEPQRSIFEAQILEQAGNLPGKTLVVQGKTEENQQRQHLANVDIISHLTAGPLAEAICAARLIICRSGYSSLMDLAQLNKVALLIPTPGQTEQAYLADYWQQKGWALVQQQDALDIRAALEAADTLHPAFEAPAANLLQEATLCLIKASTK